MGIIPFLRNVLYPPPTGNSILTFEEVLIFLSNSTSVLRHVAKRRTIWSSRTPCLRSSKYEDDFVKDVQHFYRSWIIKARGPNYSLRWCTKRLSDKNGPRPTKCDAPFRIARYRFSSYPWWLLERNSFWQWELSWCWYKCRRRSNLASR